MEKIIKTDFKEYDYLTKYEDIIQNNPNFLEYSVIQENAPTTEEKILYILSILTILYKEYTYEKYYQTLSYKLKIENSKEELVLGLNEQLKEELKRKNYKNIYIILIQNKNRITRYVRTYFKRKKTNYILEKKSLELIAPKSKKILQTNPYMINQLMQYYQNPLMQQEKIIGDILDFSRIADSLTHHNYLDSLELIKALMICNYNEQELKDVIMFVISDVYQETMANEQDPNRKFIKDLMEQEEIITNDKIIELFQLNDDFSTVILSSFLCYNMDIKEGRLDELKSKPSYEHIKKRTQK